MKHIKFDENIDADDTYKRDKSLKKQFVPQVEDDDHEFDDIPETKKWYQEIPEESGDVKPTVTEDVFTLKREANSLIHGEALAYDTKLSRVGSSDQKWAKSLLSKGAIADRVAAATVLIQDSPIHHLTTLQNLVAMVKPAKKKDSLTAIETLTELFIFDLLIPDVKLRKFESRPISQLDKMCSGNKDHRKKILLLWIYEDLLKETYGEYIKSLNSFAHDSVEAHKEKAVSAMAKLLMYNPEQEKVLLSNIVNKLGDPSQKVASKVIYQLCQVLYNHPNMKGVVLDEIEKMLFRPNISAKAQYYGVCFLNQFYLDKEDAKIAESLVRVYFSFFRACIKKGEVDSRLMGGILTGVRRCQPFLREEAAQSLQVHAHSLHRLVHIAATYTVALQALALLFQLGTSDRYYCALYKKLCHPETLTTTHPAMLLSLVYKSVKVDAVVPRALAFIKRLLQLAAASEANRACAILLVVARLARQRKLTLKKKSEIKEESMEIETKPEETNGQDLKMDGDEDKPASGGDDNLEENGAKTKKKKSRKNKSTKDGAEDVNGDHEQEKTELKIVDASQIKKKDWFIGDKADLLNEGDDDDEVYEDIPLDEDLDDHKKKLLNLLRKKKNSHKSWLHSQTAVTDATGENEEGQTAEMKAETVEGDTTDRSKEKNLEILIKKTKNMDKVVTEYSPLNRNPSFCGAEHAVVTELLLLKNHYHPSVRLFAEKILEGSSILYNGDPLKDFSIIQFLDRFAFKNPKKENYRAPQITGAPDAPMVVRGSHPKFGARKNYTPMGVRSIPVNSAAYLNEDSEHIPVDERFLYDYLQMRRQVKGDDDNSDAASDAGSVDSVEFNRYMDSLTGGDKKDSDNSDAEDDDMDYMKEMISHSKKDKGKKKSDAADGSDDEQEDDDDSIAEDGDQDVEMDSVDEEGSLLDSLDDDDDDDGSDLDISDMGSEDEAEAALEGKKKKKGKTKGNKDDELIFSEDDEDMMVKPQKNKKKGIESMFASAEEFATILEDAGTNRRQGTSQDVATADNAGVKQLNWEERRDRWVKGYDRKRAGGGGKFEKRKGGGSKFEKRGKQPDNKGRRFEGKRKSSWKPRDGKAKKFK